MVHTTLTLAQHIGRRLRARRRLLEWSQAELGERCGISFQQVHKYEAAVNRISASRLFSLAEALGVTGGYFFDGYDATGGETEPARSAR